MVRRKVFQGAGTVLLIVSVLCDTSPRLFPPPPKSKVFAVLEGEKGGTGGNRED